MYYHDNIKSTFTLTPPIHSKNNRITDKFIRSVLALYSCTASWKGLYPSSLPVPCPRLKKYEYIRYLNGVGVFSIIIFFNEDGIFPPEIGGKVMEDGTSRSKTRGSQDTV